MTLIRSRNGKAVCDSPPNRCQSGLPFSVCPTSDGNTQNGTDLSGLNHPSIAIYLSVVPRLTAGSIHFALRVNLIFPILYVLATIVICGLPMIITPVETIIGLCMILSGINSITMAFRNYILLYPRCSSVLHLCLVEKQARDDSAVVK